MENKFMVEVRFSKNRHYPQYGPNAYNIESYSVKIPYGKKFKFKSSQKAIDFAENKIKTEILDLGLDNRFNSIEIAIWRGYSGVTRHIKQNSEPNDSGPIDVEFIKNKFNEIN